MSRGVIWLSSNNAAASEPLTRAITAIDRLVEEDNVELVIEELTEGRVTFRDMATGILGVFLDGNLYAGLQHQGRMWRELSPKTGKATGRAWKSLVDVELTIKREVREL